MRIDDNKVDFRRELKRFSRQLGAASPLGNSSIDSGALVVQSPEGFQVVGTASVDGTLIIRGTLTGTGGLVWSGTFALTGTQTVSGSGKVVIGSMTLDTGGAYGGRVTATTFLVNGKLEVGSSSVFTGAVAINNTLTTNNNLLVQGLITNTGMTASASAANVYVDPSTFRLYRFTSASRFKLNQLPLDVPATLLDVRMDDWIDRGSAERYAELLDAPRPFTEIQQSEWDAPNTLRRIAGVIAEKVAEAGGEAFIVRNAQGEVDSFDSLNFALARTQILADENKELRAQIAELAKQVAKLLKK